MKAKAVVPANLNTALAVKRKRPHTVGPAAAGSAPPAALAPPPPPADAPAAELGAGAQPAVGNTADGAQHAAGGGEDQE